MLLTLSGSSAIAAICLCGRLSTAVLVQSANSDIVVRAAKRAAKRAKKVVVA